jgi:hypothetical protein
MTTLNSKASQNPILFCKDRGKDSAPPRASGVHRLNTGAAPKGCHPPKFGSKQIRPPEGGRYKTWRADRSSGCHATFGRIRSVKQSPDASCNKDTANSAYAYYDSDVSIFSQLMLEIFDPGRH